MNKISGWYSSRKRGKSWEYNKICGNTEQEFSQIDWRQCRKRIIFPLPFWVCSWDSYKKDKRKTCISLLTCILHVYVENTQEKWVTQRSGLRIYIKYHLNREGSVGLWGESKWFLGKMSGPLEE